MCVNNKSEVIQNYQCAGCVNGSFPECYEKANCSIACSKHVAGTLASRIGKMFLGLPIGFNRLGPVNEMKMDIFETFDSFQKDWGGYDMFNIPIWQHLNKENHVIVRGLSPRTNSPFLHIFLENCFILINGLKITAEDIKEMD